jgi:hypothetical protein
LAFEANQGQTDPQVKYMARGNGYTVFLTGNDTVFSLHASQSNSSSVAARHGHAASRVAKHEKDITAAISMKLVGSNPQPEISAASELPGHSNYFVGSDSSKWQQGVKQYAAVSYRDVYPGVNMAFHGQQRQLEFDFIVAPGANAAPISMGVTGGRFWKSGAFVRCGKCSSAQTVCLSGKERDARAGGCALRSASQESGQFCLGQL